MIDQKTIGKIIRLLKSKHTPLKSNIMKELGIKKFEIKNGAECPECLYIPMEFKHQIWKCPNCNYSSKDAFIPAINDYLLLHNSNFTNKEIREYLQIPSSRQTTYCLSLTNLAHKGTKRGRDYFQNNIPITTNNVSPKMSKTKSNETRGNVDEENIVLT